MRRPPVAQARVALPGVLALLLAACATPPARPPTSPSAPPPEVVSSAPPAATSAPAAKEADTSPWPRLRQAFAMQGCDYRPQVQRWAQTYAKGARQFAASWKRAMPFLLIVVDELAKRDLPGEFAMLPYLESSYQPVATRGDRPAGMWQLVPDTAREAGVVIGAGYDGRLDALASTSAALDLIARYYKEFADWRLADMAFNSGEFRVRKLLGQRDPHALSADELARFAFNPGTHEHLDRLLALACIIDDPARFGIKLPEPDEDDRLQSVTLEAGMDLRLAARLAGLGIDDVKRWNAGYRRNRMAPDAVHRLLLPAARVERFHAAADAVPLALWSDWREERAARTSGIGSWATQIGVPVAVLAAANAVDEGATVMPSTTLLLPGHEPEPVDDGRRKPARNPRVHVVVAGDTLSRVAHHYAIPLDRLQRLNPQARGTLHLGERLRLELTDD
ncbi:transglycosylase SLT domain-containing protein [Dokdonella soli]|uniref:LysM domain-containing protein n=1 Tax=Dokdonella soli TaxID=529810 RepID=A0ABN1ISN4_9GAMM